jgi:hypothetical protein
MLADKIVPAMRNAGSASHDAISEEARCKNGYVNAAASAPRISTMQQPIH